MKKLIVLFVIVMSVATTGYSQFIKQGTILGSGSFEFRSQKNGDNDDKTSSFTLMPWAGYLVVDNFAAGALLSVSSSSSKAGGSDFKSSGTDILFGPVARYYLDNGVFAHGHFAFGSGSDKIESGGTSTTTKRSISEFKLGVGYAVRITDTVLFEPIAGYVSNSTKDKDTNVKTTNSGFFLMAGFTIFLHSTN